MPRGVNLSDSRGNFSKSLFVNFVLIKEIFNIKEIFYVQTDNFSRNLGNPNPIWIVITLFQ